MNLYCLPFNAPGGRSTGVCHVNAVEVDGQAVFIVEPPVARLNGTRGLEVRSLEWKAFFFRFLYLFITACTCYNLTEPNELLINHPSFKALFLC